MIEPILRLILQVIRFLKEKWPEEWQVKIGRLKQLTEKAFTSMI